MNHLFLSRKAFFFLLAILFVAVNALFICQHYSETAFVHKFVEKHSLKFPVQSKKNAFIVSDTLRRLFVLDTSKWNHRSTNFRKMPFFRASVKNLLSSREALCGGGARVLCRMLLESGYDATRVVLVTKNFGAMGHVVVSVIIDGKEYWIDTLNSPESLNLLLKNENINSGTVKVITYRQRYNPEFTNVKYSNDSLINEFQHTYIAYTYESVPLSKLLNAAGFDVFVLNFKRPSVIFSYLAESVYLLYALTFSCAFILLCGIGYFIYFGVQFYLSLRNRRLMRNSRPG
jgi:hypothetical protein